MLYDKGNLVLTVTPVKASSKITVKVDLTLNGSGKYEFEPAAYPLGTFVGTINPDNVKIVVILLNTEQDFVGSPLVLADGVADDLTGVNLDQAYSIMAIAIPDWPSDHSEGDYYVLNNSIVYNQVDRKYYVFNGITKNNHSTSGYTFPAADMDMLALTNEEVFLSCINEYVYAPAVILDTYMLLKVDNNLEEMTIHTDISHDASKTKWYYDPSGDNLLIKTGDDTCDIFHPVGYGDYEIKLYNSSSSFLDSLTETVLIYKNLIVVFTALLDSIDTLKVNINNESAVLAVGDGVAISYLWDFGDTSTHTSMNPGNHTYSAAGVYTITLTITRTITGLADEVVTYSQEVNVGDIFCSDIYKQFYYRTSCHNYVVKENSDLDRKVFLLDSLENVISSEIINDSVTQFNINTTKDGVYTIRVEEWNVAEDIPVNPVNILLEFPIYDICDAEACYLKLINSLQCCDLVNCDDDGKKNAEMTREALNRIGGLIYFIKKYIRLENDKYLGIDNIDANRNDYIDIVDDLFRKLAITLEKCSDCFSDLDNDSECKSCNE